MKTKVTTLGVAALLCATALFHSCKNNDERLGLNRGGNPDIIVLDTFSVFTRTVPEDSFSTHRLSVNVLGAINSDTYGKSKSGIVLNFALPDITNFSFPFGSKVDSVFLVLQYAGTNQYNGNIGAQHTVNAYELTETIYRDSVYYSNRPFSDAGNIVGTYTGAFNVTDSVTAYFSNGTSQKQAPQLKMKLNNAAIGNKLVGASASDFASNTAFQNFLKGLKVEVNNSLLPANSGSMAFIYPFSNNSGIHVYYNDTQFVKFPITNVSATVNSYQHDFSGTVIQSQFNNTANYDDIYLQSMAGTKMLIEVPGLTNLALGDNYAVVGAKLIISPDLSTVGAGFDEPVRLLLLSRDSNNKSSLVVDAIAEPQLYGGTYNKNGTKQYEFNFPRHIQFLISELKNNGLNFNNGFYVRVPADGPVTATRLKVDAQKGAARGIKLRLDIIKVR